MKFDSNGKHHQWGIVHKHQGTQQLQLLRLDHGIFSARSGESEGDPTSYSSERAPCSRWIHSSRPSPFRGSYFWRSAVGHASPGYGRSHRRSSRSIRPSGSGSNQPFGLSMLEWSTLEQGARFVARPNMFCGSVVTTPTVRNSFAKKYLLLGYCQLPPKNHDKVQKKSRNKN